MKEIGVVAVNNALDCDHLALSVAQLAHQGGAELIDAIRPIVLGAERTYHTALYFSFKRVMEALFDRRILRTSDFGSEELEDWRYHY